MKILIQWIFNKLKNKLSEYGYYKIEDLQSEKCKGEKMPNREKIVKYLEELEEEYFEIEEIPQKARDKMVEGAINRLSIIDEGFNEDQIRWAMIDIIADSLRRLYK